MSVEVSVFEAKARLSELLKKIEKGEQFVITRRGKPTAVLGPLPGAKQSLRFGCAANDGYWMADDFDAELRDFEDV